MNEKLKKLFSDSLNTMLVNALGCMLLIVMAANVEIAEWQRNTFVVIMGVVLLLFVIRTVALLVVSDKSDKVKPNPAGVCHDDRPAGAVNIMPLLFFLCFAILVSPKAGAAAWILYFMAGLSVFSVIAGIVNRRRNI